MELDILKSIHYNMHGSNFINHLMKWISIISDDGLIWLGLAIIFLFFKKTRKAGILTIICIGATFVLNSILLKNIIARPRPFTQSAELATFIESLGMKLPDSYSFPSGHTFSSFACATVICLQLKKKWPFVYIFSALVAFSRVFLCCHYITDVIVGAIIGTLVAFAIYYIMKYIFKKLDELVIKHRQNKIKQTQDSQTTQE